LKNIVSRAFSIRIVNEQVRKILQAKELNGEKEIGGNIFSLLMEDQGQLCSALLALFLF
jgi:hypothetical protein